MVSAGRDASSGHRIYEEVDIRRLQKTQLPKALDCSLGGQYAASHKPTAAMTIV